MEGGAGIQGLALAIFDASLYIRVRHIDEPA